MEKRQRRRNPKVVRKSPSRQDPSFKTTDDVTGSSKGIARLIPKRYSDDPVTESGAASQIRCIQTALRKDHAVPSVWDTFFIPMVLGSGGVRAAGTVDHTPPGQIFAFRHHPAHIARADPYNFGDLSVGGDVARRNAENYLRDSRARRVLRGHPQPRTR